MGSGPPPERDSAAPVDPTFSPEDFSQGPVTSVPASGLDSAFSLTSSLWTEARTEGECAIETLPDEILEYPLSTESADLHHLASFFLPVLLRPIFELSALLIFVASTTSYSLAGAQAWLQLFGVEDLTLVYGPLVFWAVFISLVTLWGPAAVPIISLLTSFKGLFIVLMIVLTLFVAISEDQPVENIWTKSERPPSPRDGCTWRGTRADAIVVGAGTIPPHVAVCCLQFYWIGMGWAVLCLSTERPLDLVDSLVSSTVRS